MKKIILIVSLFIAWFILSWCQKMNSIDQCKNDCLDARKTRDKACLEDQECAKSSSDQYDSCIASCTNK